MSSVKSSQKKARVNRKVRGSKKTKTNTHTHKQHRTEQRKTKQRNTKQKKLPYART